MRRRQGTLRKVQITPHAPRCRCLSHPITILAKENPNSFARIPDFREIRAISHQSSHPRRKTSHFFCKDPLVIDFVHNSPRFTDNRLPSDSLSIKQGILRTKHLTLQFTIAGHAPHSPPRNQNKRARQRNLCRTLYSCISGSNRRARLFAYRLITLDVPPDVGHFVNLITISDAVPVAPPTFI